RDQYGSYAGFCLWKIPYLIHIFAILILIMDLCSVYINTSIQEIFLLQCGQLTRSDTRLKRQKESEINKIQLRRNNVLNNLVSFFLGKHHCLIRLLISSECFS